MTVYNLGSINIDHIYRLDHLPRPGETLKSRDYVLGLGGKGANQSLAAAKAGAKVMHLGAISQADGWISADMQSAGVDTSHILNMPDIATGHAIIMVDTSGENAILLHGGANLAITKRQVTAGLSGIGPKDILMLQNETAQQVEAAAFAHKAGARVIYSAAPFSVKAVKAVLPYLSIIALNEGEARQLFAELGPEVPVDGLLVTQGQRGAEFHDLRKGQIWHQAAFPVTPVDTTGAGDCFAGWFAAGLARGETIPTALHHAAAAAALQVTREGAGPAMPDRNDVLRFIDKAKARTGKDLSVRLVDPMCR